MKGCEPKYLKTLVSGSSINDFCHCILDSEMVMVLPVFKIMPTGKESVFGCGIGSHGYFWQAIGRVIFKVGSSQNRDRVALRWGCRGEEENMIWLVGYYVYFNRYVVLQTSSYIHIERQIFKEVK